MLGSFTVHGNDYYTPDRSDAAPYVNTRDCRVDTQAATCPLGLTLIGYQVNDKMLFRQDIIVQNIGQLRHAYSRFSRYAVIVPTAALNEKGRGLPEDWIANILLIGEMKEIKG